MHRCCSDFATVETFWKHEYDLTQIKNITHIDHTRKKIFFMSCNLTFFPSKPHLAITHDTNKIDNDIIFCP